jgi:hypothetical protein
MITFLKKLFKLKPKMKVGDKITLKSSTPVGKPSSSNTNLGSNRTFTIKRVYKNNGLTAYDIVYNNDTNCGWVYAHETVEYAVTLEMLNQELNEKQFEINSIKSKIEYLTETGLTEVDENQYKVYTTLKLIENNRLSTVEKSKIIAQLIKGS